MMIEHDTARISRLVEIFNGAIKYAPMLMDLYDWSDDECVAFARKWHARAINGLRLALARKKAEGLDLNEQQPRWNEGIPYCRNIPTEAMIAEASKK